MCYDSDSEDEDSESISSSDGELQPSENTSHFPIDMLPQDILVEIFIHCLPKIFLWPGARGDSNKDVAPLLLCNVCSSWRTLALSTPYLWKTLSLTFKKTIPELKELEETIAMTHAWLKRSGELPLTLKMYASTLPYSCDIRGPCEALLNALTDYASRWEHVGLNIHWQVDPPITLPQVGNMPRLRTLSITSENVHLPLTSCPKLTGISWPRQTSVSLAPLPWAQLAHVDLIYSLSTCEILFVIRSCPKLTEFKATLDDKGDHSTLPRSAVVSRSLQSIQLDIGEIYTKPFLKRLTLPALTDFSIEFPDVSPAHSFWKELLRFFSRSKCRLDQAVFTHCGFNDLELLECLEHDSCASLTQLQVIEGYNSPMFTDNVLVALTDTTGRIVLLPELEKLSLIFCVEGSSGRLGAMVLSRRIPCHKENKLRSLDITYDELHQCDMTLLDLAEKLGLRVKYRHE